MNIGQLFDCFLDRIYNEVITEGEVFSMMKRALLVLFLFSLSLGLYAQSNDMMDELLAQENATFGLSAYLILTAAGHLSETADPIEAMTMASDMGWMKIKKEADAAIRFGEYAYLLIEAFDLPGGLMYRIIPGPRYASRELYFLGITEKQLSPYMRISGEEAVRFLGNTLQRREEL